MDFQWYHYLLLLSGGALAGSINTLAGNGSAITLSLFTEMLGLPANIANGTNRVGVLTQAWAGTYAFHKHGKLKLEHAKTNVAVTTAGALVGVGIAISISNEQFLFIYKYLMVAVLLILLIKPKRWLQEGKEGKSNWKWLELPLYFALGIYGGFIQMGMGVFYLATVVLVSRYSIIVGNALKGFVVALYTIPVLLIFHFRGLVQWDLGLLMAVGQTIGGYYTAVFASRFSRANEVAYYVLLVIVMVALWSLFGGRF